ncbi:hypothetical protein GQE99_08030 [Maritimibacter sp. DP07]|uniref:Uncharacterized protein n=1 Tax=Maritimibacter harenae TaxID=2606218 RepID=A0A845LYU7_9RHOB|nr:hypothetical protein [Maritimibacter harenae]MZR12965.1 hypothetical protein [Maritimibacter harenae]
MRRILLGLMAAATAGLVLFVLGSALVAGKLTGQVFVAVLPLVILFTLAWNGLTRPRD